MKSSVIKYFGGKAYLADWVLSHAPPHTKYVEPFFGSGAVLFAKDPAGVAEVVNDLRGDLINFWQVLRDPRQYEEFVRVIEATPMCEAIWDQASNTEGDSVQAAINFFIRFRQSREGKAKSFCTPTRRTRRGMEENVSSWWSAVDGLDVAHARLSRVLIFNRDAVDVIQQNDGQETFFYLDPPYLHETRVSKSVYQCEMSVEQHVRLLDVLKGLEGKFLLSGYPSELYDAYGWERIDRVIDNKSSAAKQKPKKTECLWKNF